MDPNPSTVQDSSESFQVTKVQVQTPPQAKKPTAQFKEKKKLSPARPMNQIDRLASVSTEDLETIGGNTNRLYQPLTGGKKVNSLAFNDTTSKAAEARDDLFTLKQREALKKRRLLLREVYDQELKGAAEEADKHKAEKTRRKHMEKEAKEVTLRFGYSVQIHSLVDRTDLNGARGT